MPKISVLMSVYNEEKYIKEAIDSVLSQTFTDFEFIIIDDGSTDSTWEIINSYDDARIIKYRFPINQGVGAALNFGLKKVSGKYLAKVDGDDINHLKRFEEQYNYLETHKDIALVDSYIEYFTEDNGTDIDSRSKYLLEIHKNHLDRVTTVEDYKTCIYWFCCLVHSATMFRTKIVKDLGYNKELRICEDYDLFYRINKLRYNIAKVPLKLVRVRITNNSTTVVENLNLINYIYNLKINEFLNLTKFKKKGVFIWGAGEFGKKVYELLTQQGYKILGFIDSNPSRLTNEIKGTKVYNYSILEDKKDSAIVVASTLGKFEIAEELKRKGFNHLENFLIFM